MKVKWSKTQYAKGIGTLISILLVVGMSACGAFGKTDSVGEKLPDPVLNARAWLGDQLEVDSEEIELLSYEQEEWSDSCYGLGGAAEICAAVVTPGWRVLADVKGEEYEVRTDETGTLARSPQIP